MPGLDLVPVQVPGLDDLLHGGSGQDLRLVLDDFISTVIGLPSLESKDRASSQSFLLGIPSALQAASSLPPRKDLLRLLLAVVLLLAGHFQEARPRVERDQDRVDDELRRGSLERVV